MKPNISPNKLFVLIANRRTGSNYLMKVFDSFSEIEFFGEVYHWDTVWMPNHRKQEYVKWLKTNQGININIGDKPFEDQELVKFNHREPEHFLNFLVSSTPNKYAGFKIFPEHLSWEKLERYLLSNKEITKIILKRNLLDVYISDKILQLTKHSQKYNTSNIQIDVDCIDFKKWYFETQSYYSNIEFYLKNSSQQYLELSYEDIHKYTSDEEKLSYIHSWFKQHNFEIREKINQSEFTTKQDQRKNSIDKVKNADEIKHYLHRNNLQYLIQC